MDFIPSMIDKISPLIANKKEEEEINKNSKEEKKQQEPF